MTQIIKVARGSSEWEKSFMSALEKYFSYECLTNADMLDNALANAVLEADFRTSVLEYARDKFGAFGTFPHSQSSLNGYELKDLAFEGSQGKMIDGDWVGANVSHSDVYFD